MTILIINWQDWHNRQAGGAEVYLYEIFSRLRRRGHRVILLCSRGAGQSPRELCDGVEIIRLGRRGNFNFLAPVGLSRVLRHTRVDVVIDDLNKIPFYSPLFTRAPVVGMPMHLFRQAIYEETNFLLATYVFLAEQAIPLFYRRDPFIAISQSTADDLRHMGLCTPIYIVRCGRPRVPAVEDERREPNLVCYVGRLKAYKSIDHLFRAAALVRRQRNIDLLVAGDGDARPGLEKLASRLGLPVRFAGFVTEDEKFRIYRRARLVVQPSIKEGWGLTAMEAQACGTPVVCADSPGLREVVQPGVSGYLYPYGDINRLCERITELLLDDKQWSALSRGARRWTEQFSWDRAADEMESILGKLISRRAS